jgi:hypothetical protein
LRPQERQNGTERDDDRVSREDDENREKSDGSEAAKLRREAIVVRWCTA